MRRFGTAGAAVLVLLAGCAAPGPPLPPTLNLPQVVTAASLTAVREGDGVRLRWTTPSQTTDKLLIKGAVTAVICRDATAREQAKTPCSAVERVTVTAGASEAVDPLPAALTAGPARLLKYRVELENSADRSAGLSPAVYAAAGSAPAAVADFTGGAAKGGIFLRWKPEAGAGTVELERTTLNPAPATQKQGGLLGETKEPEETRFRAGEGAEDAGGMIDRTAELGKNYSYQAQRVEVESVDGQRVELRSVRSETIELAVEDVFPPDRPMGLVAAPEPAGEGQAAAIDLSWIPVMEPGATPRLAGYRVYRREALEDMSGAWKRITPEAVTVAAYRDATVVAGKRYQYMVSSVSTTGAESAPSDTVVETAPGQ